MECQKCFIPSSICFFKNNNNSACISPAIKLAFSINIILREITPYNWQVIIFSKIQNLRYWNASGHVFQSIMFFSTRMISLHNSDFCELTNYLFMGMKKVIFQLPYYHPLLSWMNFFSVFFVQMISILCVFVWCNNEKLGILRESINSHLYELWWAYHIKEIRYMSARISYSQLLYRRDVWAPL